MLSDSFAQKSILRSLENITHGGIRLTTPEGKEYFFSGNQDGAMADIHIHDWKVAGAVFLRGDVGLAETYRDGLWDSTDLEALVTFGLLNEAAMDNVVYGAPLFRAISRIAYLFRSNTLRGSRKNISAHYDLGNAFYKLWLDESMTYSSAIFDADNAPLKQGQDRKYDRLLERLGDKPAEILEIGCGWGGFAERAVSKSDHSVRGLTLSSEQLRYAQDRLKPYASQAQVALEDYRLQNRRYDHIVSIEMFEAVGERYWDTYFQKIASSLKPKGKALVQTITIEESHFQKYRSGGDMIRTFIFPGGMLPSWERFEQRAKAAGLRMTDRYAFGKDYAQTLRLWLAKFDAEEEALDLMGFDNKFRRLWRMYLAGCAASFAVGRTDVMQMELEYA